MPEVSILMNCYNGDKYLKLAIESVIEQEMTDWEIIFVDNCSTDRSIEIAESYGNKIIIIKTEKTIPLGEARNFGLTHCSGDYISFLDTDDIWMPNALTLQLQAIKSGDYAIAYGGHYTINSDGVIFDEMAPKFKKGIVFEELLLQFDIPIVTSMVSKKYLLKSGLNFDINIHASEEYCLFMQLAVKYPVIVIKELITKYRIHDGALTNKTISKWAKERRYTLDKIIRENVGVNEEYKKSFEEAYARAAYYEAQYLMSVNRQNEALDVMREYKFNNVTYFLLYGVMRYSKYLWNKIQQMKYDRKI